MRRCPPLMLLGVTLRTAVIRHDPAIPEPVNTKKTLITVRLTGYYGYKNARRRFVTALISK